MLTLPLAEFIAKLQELHAKQGNHPLTKLRITSLHSPDMPEVYVDHTVSTAGGMIVASCFSSTP